MSALLGIFFTGLGFTCLCGSMPRHQGDLFGRRLSAGASRGLRVAGFSLLALALVVDLWFLPVAQGAIAWCGHLTVGAVAAVAVLMLRQRIA
ncbi:MAG: DUF3325 family protein [Acidobacteriota bacterium]